MAKMTVDISPRIGQVEKLSDAANNATCALKVLEKALLNAEKAMKECHDIMNKFKHEQPVEEEEI